MNRWGLTWKKASGLRILCSILSVGLFLLPGCGSREKPEQMTVPEQKEMPETGEEAAQKAEEQALQGKREGKESKEESGCLGESARDGTIDFPALQKINPDIFAWLYIPDTQIDCPVLQSQEADDYYESHNAFQEISEEGAPYTELANLRDMCDFNTVIHGKSSFRGEETGQEASAEGVFADLKRFADPAFFDSHQEFYIYLEDNLLTYTIFAAYERENTSLIRSYDFTYGGGCEAFLEDMYGLREMGKNLREGWEDVTPYHFLVTLTAHSSENPEKQFVVLGALISDAAGKIDRQVEW